MTLLFMLIMTSSQLRMIIMTMMLMIMNIILYEFVADYPRWPGSEEPCNRAAEDSRFGGPGSD